MSKFNGERLRKKREELGLTLFDLAVRCYPEVRIQPQTIHNWEQGKHIPGLELFVPVAKALKTPIRFFFK